MVKIKELSEKDYYWNFIDEKDMKIFLKKAKKNWKKAVNELKISDYMKDYILNEKSRGKLVEFMEKELKIKKKNKVLDIGAGMGALSIALARRFDVSSVDINKLTLEFVKYRAEQEKVKLTLYKTDLLHKGLLFKKNEFGVIVMNGVLEWVAFNVSKGNVKEIQEKVLKDVRRVLKKNGFLILAIENRFALDWFKGKTSHTRIKFIDLMPRKIADVVCKRKKGRCFETYLYSLFGYKKMLGKTGFKNIEFYEAYPTYQKPEWIKKTKNLFANSYIIVCKKE